VQPQRAVSAAADLFNTPEFDQLFKDFCNDDMFADIASETI